MNKYYIQEKIGYNNWFDLYTADLCVCKEMILILKKKNPDNKYRIVSVFL